MVIVINDNNDKNNNTIISIRLTLLSQTAKDCDCAIAPHGPQPKLAPNCALRSGAS